MRLTLHIKFLLLFIFLNSCNKSIDNQINNEPKCEEINPIVDPSYFLFDGIIGGTKISTIKSIDGYYLTCGYTADGSSFFLIKTNQYGELIWTKSYSNEKLTSAHGLIENNSGDIIIGGNNYIDSSGIFNISVARMTSSGDLLWLNTYESIKSQRFVGIEQSTGSDFKIILEIENPQIEGGTDIGLLSIDSTGMLISNLVFPSDISQIPQFMFRTKSNDFIIIGIEPTIQDRIFTMSINNNGDVNWKKNISGSKELFINSATEIETGEIVLCGKIYDREIMDNQYAFVKLSKQGDLIWLKNHGIQTINEEANSIISSEQGFITIGTINHCDSSNTDSDIGLINIDHEGELINLVYYENHGIWTSRGENIIKTDSERNLISGQHQYSKLFLMNIDDYGN